MAKSTRKKEKGTAFSKIQAKYGVRKPEQIKMRILWFNLQQIILATFPGADTKHRLQLFDQEWKACETEEQ